MSRNAQGLALWQLAAIAVASAALIPTAAIMLAATAYALFPAGLIALPFMLSTFFGGAVSGQKRSPSWRPAPQSSLAGASAT